MHLLAQESDLGAQVRDLRDERFVLRSQDGGGDEPDEKRQAGHGAAEGVPRDWSRNSVAGERRDAA